MTFSFARPTLTTSAAEESTRMRTAIAQADLFSTVSVDAVEDLAERASLRRIPAHGTIVSQDEPGDAMFLIVSGRVKVGIFGENGREVTLSVLRQGQCFGEMSLFDGKERSANCIATEPTTLVVLHRQELLRHIARYPATALNLLGEMANRLRRADESIAQLALCDVNERLVHRLICLAEEEGTETPEGVLVRRRPTQQELANMIGSCRETISRAFNQLAREGLIIARGRSLVVTSALLAKSSKAIAA
jgi:CRP-like cAMP-binding protein